jgi:hypothetical protein
MAAETTSTTVATNKLSYMLSRRALPANLAKIVFTPLCNDDDIAGEPTSTRQYPVLSDLGAASAGTEGTAITTNTELGYGSAIQGTPVEGALVRATVTDRSVEVAYPGMAGVTDLVQRGTFDQQMAMFMPHLNRLAGMCIEKKEADGLAKLTGFSSSVGTSGADFTADDAFTAIYTFATLEGNNSNNAWLLTPNQATELRRDVALTGGGLGGGVWFGQADASFMNGRSLSVNGLQGTFMGRPLYEYSHSLRVLSDTNANVNGALIAIGSGRPDEGQLGGVGFVRNGGLKVRIEPSAEARGSILVVSLEYVAVEVADAHGVRIRTGAPA